MAGALDGPYVRVIGTVQDGGLPHVACTGPRCMRARQDPSFRRYIASLALILPSAGEVYVLDATPDLRQQLDLLEDVRRPPPGRVDRSPLDGVLLTHAHMGHYLGLAYIGYEAVHTQGMPVFCTPRMAAFLRRHGPWSQLVEMGNIELREAPPGKAFQLGEVMVTPLKVPHRDEFSDTVGFRLEGPSQTLLYVPDTDAWEAWDPPLEDILAGVDIAFLDGTFFSLAELPGRDVASVPHPLISGTLERLAGQVRSGLRVHFTHLNHSNPALEPESPATRQILEAGFEVLAEGEEFRL